MNRLKIIGIVLLVLIVPLAMFAWAGGMQWLTAPFRGALDQREQIQADGNFRIFSYNHFYDLCRSIQNSEATHDDQYDVLQDMSPEEDYNRQRRNVAVLKSEIERRKQRYNADAAKEETIAAFKANDLPNRITVGAHDYGNRTNCQF